MSGGAAGGDWALGPLSPPERILETRAAKDLFNPVAAVRDGRVSLLVRAEDKLGRYAGVSRIGVAAAPIRP